jgi:23S rRNA (cytidine1920-2'-O)/16S rRNA (cytidine1409-2'-O)-methyltransferase
MRVDVLLVTQGFCTTRQEAREAILKGKVLVNGGVILKQSKDVKEGSILEMAWSRPYVSRGGEKIEGSFS